MWILYLVLQSKNLTSNLEKKKELEAGNLANLLSGSAALSQGQSGELRRRRRFLSSSIYNLNNGIRPSGSSSWNVKPVVKTQDVLDNVGSQMVSIQDRDLLQLLLHYSNLSAGAAGSTRQ